MPLLVALRAHPTVFHCPLLSLTGCPCPLCGGTRSVQALLLDGSLVSALRWHPVVPFALALGMIQILVGDRTDQPRRPWAAAWLGLGLATLAWWLLRML